MTKLLLQASSLIESMSFIINYEGALFSHFYSFSGYLIVCLKKVETLEREIF